MLRPLARHALALCLLCACRSPRPPSELRVDAPSAGDVRTPALDAAVAPPPDARPPALSPDASRALLAGESAPDPALDALIASTAQRVSQVRGLPLLRPVERGVMTREGIRARAQDRVREEYGPGEVALEGELYRRVGLLPEGLDYERAMFDLLEEQIAGFYDPSVHRLFLASWLAPEMQLVTLSHELVHTLQDQHFDIERFMHHRRGGGDAQTAVQTVLEGDATYAGLEDLLRAQGRSLRSIPNVLSLGPPSGVDASTQPRLAAAPPALQEVLLFPYREGFALAVRTVRDGGFAAMDALLRDPPTSTEQLLHPERLAAREAPVDVPPTDVPSGYRLAYDDVLGEFGLRLFLGDAVTPPVANQAAEGWGGDRAQLLLPVGAPAGALGDSALAWRVVFDTAGGRAEAEATQFERAARRVLARRYGARTVSVAREGGSLAAHAMPNARFAAVVRRGGAVLVLDRVSEAALRELAGR